MGMINKMIRITSVFAACLVLTGAVTPLTPDELQQIRDFTAKAHMKRLQAYPDQIMTPSTHYLGRRLPAPATSSGENKQPTVFMQAPNNGNGANKPAPIQVEPLPAGAVQSYLTYPLAPNPQGPPPPLHHGGPFFHPKLIPQNLPPQLQHAQQSQHPQQQPQQPQGPLQFVPVQTGPGGPLRGPPPQIQQQQQQQQQQQYGKRPSFFSFGEAVPPTSSILEFFFPRRPSSPRRPISFRPPFRIEFGQPVPPALYQHQQSIQTVMAQQHLNTVQQQQQAQAAQVQAQAQQSVVQQSTAPVPAAPSGASGPSAPAQGAQNPQVNPNARPILPPSGPYFPSPLRSPLAFLNHYRELPFFKAFGKPLSAPKYPPPVNPVTIVPPQSRPGEGENFVPKFATPQQHEFSFIPNGPHLPPPGVVPGPNNKPFNNPPVSFSHIEQVPFSLAQHSHGRRPLPMAMIVQGQEFPHYQFSTTFGAGNQGTVQTAVVQPSTHGQKEGQASTVQQTVRQTQRVKKVRARPNGPTTTPNPASSTPSLGQVIFESSKETREFHDSARIVAPTVNNNEAVKIRKQKHHHIEHGNLPKASESSSVVVAPLVFTEESSEPITSPRPVSSTSVSVSTVVTTTQEPHKSKIIKAAKVAEFHKTKSDKKVTASGAGLGAVTIEPMRISTTSSNKNTPGRVVTTSVTSRVVSSGPKEQQQQQNSQKRYRLRKVKVPNPEAKGNKGSSTGANTTNSPTTTTFSSTRSRPTTTLSSTESSFTTEI